MIKINRIKIILTFLCVFLVVGLFTVGNSKSYFSDSVNMTAIISTGNWNIESTDKSEPGDIIINEIHWAGSLASDDDQWIELLNTTEKDISLKGWVIENASNSKNDLKITGNPTVESGEYLLITRRKPNSDESALAVSSDVQNGSLSLDRAGYKELTLKDGDGNTIDKTPEVNSPWPEGEYIEEERYFSMQRMNNTNETGEENSSWYTCNPDEFSDNELSLMYDYWKEEFHDYVCGTPRNKNLPSDNSDEDSNSLSTPESPQLIEPLNVGEENKKEDEENGDPARANSVQTDSQSSDSSSKINEDDDSDTDTDSNNGSEIDEDKEKLNNEDQNKDDSEDNTADDPSESNENNEVINSSEQEDVNKNSDDEKVNDDSGSEGTEESNEEQENTEEETNENTEPDEPSESPEDSTESSQGTEETESQTSDDNSGDSDEEQSN